MRERAEQKGRRVLGEGRLTLKLVTPRRVEAICRGSLGEEYRLGFEPSGAAHCTCPARGRCSHLYALALVCNRPRLEER